MINKNQAIDEAIRILKTGWCKEFSAKDSYDKQISCLDSKAVKFCAIGALERAFVNLDEDFDYDDGEKIKSFIREKMGGSISHFNDGSESVEVVIKALKSAKD